MGSIMVLHAKGLSLSCDQWTGQILLELLSNSSPSREGCWGLPVYRRVEHLSYIHLLCRGKSGTRKPALEMLRVLAGRVRCMDLDVWNKTLDIWGKILDVWSKTLNVRESNKQSPALFE